MSWNHLPVAGGVYDQNPRMLDDFLTIDGKKVQAENKRIAADNRKSRKK